MILHALLVDANLLIGDPPREQQEMEEHEPDDINDTATAWFGAVPHRWRIETSLIFIDGLDLPYFAAFHLLRDKTGRDALVRYYERYIAIAQADGVGFILESPTWRASSDWEASSAIRVTQSARSNRELIKLMHELKARHAHRTTPIVVSGCVGPRGDGYDPGQVMSPTEAAAYHAHQIGVFAEAKADMTTAITMTNASEAIGFVHAAAHVGLPSVVSFTVETDGRLPTGRIWQKPSPKWKPRPAVHLPTI